MRFETIIVIFCEACKVTVKLPRKCFSEKKDYNETEDPKWAL